MTYEEPLCGECRAARATLEISVYNRGSVREQRVMCAKCAENYERLTFGRRPGVGLVQLVAHIADKHAEHAGASSKMGCPVCGTMLAEVVTGGFPGCATCYTRFAKEIEPVISATQGAVIHRGKVPPRG